MPVLNCRFFSGYKPCGKSVDCSQNCPSLQEVNMNLLIVHLGALGAVVRSTALLSTIRAQYPRSRLFWVTDSPAHKLIKDHPLLDGVFTTSDSDLLELSAWDFDAAFVIDKSRKAAGVVRRLHIDQIHGFAMDAQNGAILPASSNAKELWDLGLSDEKKFFINQKPETQLVHEALEFGKWQRAPYNLPLTFAESKLSMQRKLQWQQDLNAPIIGLNTGASNIIPAKKWTVEYQRELIVKMQAWGFQNIVLLGGPEDAQRNFQIAQGFDVILSPTELGLRDGLVSVDACDLVVSGDSLGMHMAIAREKFVIAWFGPTCAQEIDLYERGIKILSKVSCGPCWKRDCSRPQMCYDHVDLKEIHNALEKGKIWWNKSRSSLSRQPFLEI